MSVRWGDSQRDRMELDRWITREDDTMNDLQDAIDESGYDGPIPTTQSEADALPTMHPARLIYAQRQAIEAGMWKWEAGTLTRTTLNQILEAALHDLWCDSYRNGAPELQRRMFRERLESALRTATSGHEFRVS